MFSNLLALSWLCTVSSITITTTYCYNTTRVKEINYNFRKIAELVRPFYNDQNCFNLGKIFSTLQNNYYTNVIPLKFYSLSCLSFNVIYTSYEPDESYLGNKQISTLITAVTNPTCETNFTPSSWITFKVSFVIIL